MHELLFEPVTTQDGERYWLLYEPGRVHRPLAAIHERVAARWAERVLELRELADAVNEEYNGDYIAYLEATRAAPKPGYWDKCPPEHECLPF